MPRCRRRFPDDLLTDPTIGFARIALDVTAPCANLMLDPAAFDLFAREHLFLTVVEKLIRRAALTAGDQA